MNDKRDDSEDFSLKRQDHIGRAPGTDKSGEDPATKSARADNALPDRIRRKYYVVANESEKDGPDGEARLYADEQGEYLAFKVTEDRLVTRLAAAEVVRDMVSVAQHRQWEALEVRGSAEFRREAWLEAGARGIEVQGYQPTELDRQTLAGRREVWDRTHPRTPELAARSTSDRGERADKFDYDKGISGRLIEVDQAPYRNRTDAEASTYCMLLSSSTMAGSIRCGAWVHQDRDEKSAQTGGVGRGEGRVRTGRGRDRSRQTQEVARRRNQRGTAALS